MTEQIETNILDRFERWREATAEAMPAEQRYENRHLFSFGWWPDGRILYEAEFGFRCMAGEDGRFWKNGDIRAPAGHLAQLEIALRYGPHALMDYDIDDLVENVSLYLQHHPFEAFDEADPGSILYVLQHCDSPRQDEAAERAWQAIK